MCTARLRGEVQFGSVVQSAVCRMSEFTRVTVMLLGSRVFFLGGGGECRSKCLYPQFSCLSQWALPTMAHSSEFPVCSESKLGGLHHPRAAFTSV